MTSTRSSIPRRAGTLVHVVRRVGFGVLALGMTGLMRVEAAAIVSPEFGQLDWFDSSGSLQTQNSSWGRVVMNVVPDAGAVSYLNIVGDAGSGSAWIVQNMPIFPTSVGAPSRQAVEFSIADLGLAAGTRLAGMNAFFSLDSAPRSTAPAGVGAAFAVASVAEQTTGSPLGGPLGDVGAPAGHKARAESTKVIQHKGVPAVEELKNQCLPGSLARSIGWLNTEYKLGSPKTAQEIFKDLLALKIGADFASATNGYEDMLGHKATYLDGLAGASGRHAKTKVLDLNNRIGPIPGVREETGIDLIEWLYRELPTEDVELDWESHIVTITGIYMQGGQTFVRYKDDRQGDGKADDFEIDAPLTLVDGKYKIRSGRTGKEFQVQMVISESIPEPATLPLLAIGVAMLVWGRRAGAR